MNINEQAKKAEKQIVANYVYKNDLCIRRLIQKKSIEEFLQNINVFKTNLIRLGNESDGGYLIPDDLNGIPLPAQILLNKYRYSKRLAN